MRKTKVKTTLKMKGLNTPRIFLWIKGFIHGKIIHTGGLDPESNTVASGYIAGQIERFRNTCTARCEQGVAKLVEAWRAADQYLIDYADIFAKLSKCEVRPNVVGEPNAQVRAKEKASERQATLEAERMAILKNLANIENEIRAEISLARNQMEATADMLLSAFSCYGHGLLMRPVFARLLPEVTCEDCAEKIIANHEDTWNTIASILKEVKHECVEKN